MPIEWIINNPKKDDEEGKFSSEDLLLFLIIN
jgi:hypothetical protein